MGVFDAYLKDNFVETDQESCLSVFQTFDTNRDGYFDQEEFSGLLRNLVADISSSENGLKLSDVSVVFSALDLDNDGRISFSEFKYAWQFWLRQEINTVKPAQDGNRKLGEKVSSCVGFLLKQILKPVKALVLVDVQNDFISGTLSLSSCPASQDGAAVVPVINSLLDQKLFDVVVYTYDWHPKNHISFIENVDLRPIHPSSKIDASNAKTRDTVYFDIDSSPREQILWPKHCVQGSNGAELHPDLKVVDKAFHVKKGINSDIDSYSAFWDNDKLSQTELSSILSQNRVTDVYVCGLAYDVCVGFTATHSVEHGFRTILIEDASRGVSLDGIAKMKSSLESKGVLVADSSQVPALTHSQLRPQCLILQAALNYKTAWDIVRAKSKS